MSQIQDGEEKVISYASHKLSKAERNYCITRKELLAVYRYVLHFKHYLYGRRFTVRTDHQALTWLLNWDRPNTSQYCSWRAELECYDMEIKYRPGKLHANADALSRIPQCQQCELKHIDPQQKRNVKVNIAHDDSHEHILCRLSQTSTHWSQSDDEDLQLVINMIKNKQIEKKYPKELDGASRSVKTLWTLRKSLCLRSGLLQLQLSNGKCVLVVPQSKRQWIVKTTHHTLGHVGITKTLSALRNRYYWPDMDQEVRLWINSCRPCARRKTGNVSRQPERMCSKTGFPFEKLAIDITGPLPTTRSGYRYILGVIDYFSKYPMLIPLRRVDAQTVAEAILTRWISIFGAPLSINSDRGTCFEAEVFQEMCALLRIKKTHSAPYYPQSNGLIERLFRTVKDMVFATSLTYQSEWDKVIHLVEMGLRSTIHSSTRLSPHEVLFGYSMRLPISWNVPAQDELTLNVHKETGETFYSDYVLELKQRLENIRRQCLKQCDKAIVTDRNPNKSNNSYEIGFLVMARILPVTRGIGVPRYDGPYRIVKKIGEWTYEIVHVETGEQIQRNHHHLKLFRATPYLPSTKEQDDIPPRTRAPPDRLGFSRKGGNVLYLYNYR